MHVRSRPPRSRRSRRLRRTGPLATPARRQGPAALPPVTVTRQEPAATAVSDGAAPLRRRCRRGAVSPASAGRRTMRPRQVGIAALVALVLGLVLNAVPMERAAETSRYGLRRDAALTVLRPLAALATTVRLDRPRARLDALLGHDGGGGTTTTSALAGAEVGGALTPMTGAPARPGAAARHAHGGVVEVTRVPSAGDPLRLWVGGDSVAGFLSLEMNDVAAATGVVRSHSHYKISTGLSRPDYYDWPAHLEEDMRTYDPEVVVFLVGANDDQPLQDARGAVADFGSAAWRGEYGRRVGAVIDRLVAEHRTVVWVGLPVMRSGDFDARMAVIDSIAREQARLRSQAMFFDSRPVLADAAGRYAAYLPESGEQVLMRADDGIHLTPAGGRRLAEAVLTAVLGRLAAGETVPVLAPGPR